MNLSNSYTLILTRQVDRIDTNQIESNNKKYLGIYGDGTLVVSSTKLNTEKKMK